MIPGPPLLLRCPHCHDVKEISNLVSGNTSRAIRWSDMKTIYPKFPSNSRVQLCPHCEKFFFLDDAETFLAPDDYLRPGQLILQKLITSIYDENKTDSERQAVLKDWFKFQAGEENKKETEKTNTGHLIYPKAKEALSELYDTASEDRKYILRLYVLHAFNDKFCREEGNIPTDKDRQFFRENCLALINMNQTSGTLKAELYREISDFDNCIKTLDSLEPAIEREQYHRDRIREKALKGESNVFELNNDEEDTDYSFIPRRIPRRNIDG